MTESLLRSIRERLIDESEPLAGLLRKCLLLAAETKSDSLRRWARYELNGYDEGIDLPSYRMIPTPPIKVDYVSGNTRVTNQTFLRVQLPEQAREFVPESLSFSQPVEELEKLAEQKSLSFTGGGLAYAQSSWGKELGWMQQITGMHFDISGTVILGILGKIRTQLVDLIADLTSDTPLAELPHKDSVDAAVGQHIGMQYNTTIKVANGPTAIGNSPVATTQNLNIEEVLKLIEAVVSASEESGEFEGKPELLEAAEELHSEITAGSPTTGEVVKKAGRLQKLSEGVGIPLLTAAVAGAVEAAVALALGGTFG